MASKKRATKKLAKSLKKKHPFPPILKVKVHIIPLESGANPGDETASGSSSDQVRWYNDTDRGRTVVFMPMDPAEVKDTWWPFVEPPEFITVEPGRLSKAYTLYSRKVGTATEKQYFYRVDPPLEGEQGGPGDPAVIVDY